MIDKTLNQINKLADRASFLISEAEGLLQGYPKTSTQLTDLKLPRAKHTKQGCLGFEWTGKALNYGYIGHATTYKSLGECGSRIDRIRYAKAALTFAEKVRRYWEAELPSLEDAFK